MTRPRLRSPLLSWLIPLTLTCALGPTARGQEPPALFPAGYLGHRELTAALRALQRAHPDRVRLTALSRSLEGREVWLVTLGRPDAAAAPRPAVLVVANLEADHVVGSQVALGLAERLAAAAGKEADWLDRCTIHIVPRLNPDGAERALESPRAEARGNLRALDHDRDGRQAEDGPDDLDGDGVITRMRVKDPATATLVPDAKDPRILRPADAAKGEPPVFAEEAEGRDDDGDGLRNEDPRGGVNLNRNWPHRWTEFDPDTGFSPASEPEVQALIAWAFAHPEIAVVWSFGLNDSLREEPKKPGTDLDDADLPIFAELSRSYQKLTAPRAVAAGGSPAGKGTPAPGATTDGSLAAWAYHQFGAVSVASRLWTTPEIPSPNPRPAPSQPAGATETEKKEKGPEKQKQQETAGEALKKGAAAEKSAAPAPAPKPPAIPEEGEARWLYWNDRVVGGRAFVPFHAFTHPTLGAVEIGGWKPGVRLNPPAAEIDALATSHAAVLRDLAGRLPRLAAPEVKVEARGGGLFAVTAVVRNDGYFPTALAQGVRNRKAPAVQVRLDPAGASVVAGKARDHIDSLPGSGGRKEYHWLLLLPESARNRDARLEVASPRAGRVETVIPLR